MSFKFSKFATLFTTLCLISACMGLQPPYQTLHEARTAIDAAENKIGPCPCESLTPAQQAYHQAKLYNERGQYHQARLAARKALHQAQVILRQQP